MTPSLLIEILSDAGYWVKYSSAVAEDWVGPTDNKHVFTVGCYDENTLTIYEIKIRIRPEKFVVWSRGDDDNPSDTSALLAYIDEQFRKQGLEVG